MELFCVQNRANRKILKGGFNNKKEAKGFRNSLLSPEELKDHQENPDKPMPYIVTLGKDHRNVKH
jgi:hypothetical protein